MIVKYILFLSLFSSNFAFALTQKEAENVAKERFKLAADSAFSYLQTCSKLQNSCGLNQRHVLLGRAIMFELLKFHNPELVFESEKENPGSFLLDGQVRIAKTGSLPGDPVYINTDLITREKNGVYAPFELDEAVGVLVHELGHHHHDAVTGAPVTHEELDLLGSYIKLHMIEGKEQIAVTSSEVPALGSSKVIMTTYTAYFGGVTEGETFAHLVVGNAGVVDLRDLANTRLTCPKSSYLGEIDFQGSPLFYNLKSFFFEPVSSTTSNFEIRLNIADAGVACRNELPGRESEFRYFRGYKNGSLVLPFSTDNNSVQFLENEVEFVMQTPPDEIWH